MKDHGKYVLALIVAGLLLTMMRLGLKGESAAHPQIARAMPPAADSREQGLLVRFAQPGRSDARAARFLSLHVEPAESPTPFLEPGPFQAAWEGWIEIPDEDKYTLRFEGTGRLEVSLGDFKVLRSGQTVSEPLSLSAGRYALRVSYHSPEEGPARMRLLWSASLFGPEPISPLILSHDASDTDLRRGELLRRGRILLAEHRCLNCHRPEDPSFLDEAWSMPELSMDAPDLHGLGGRLRGPWMHRWVKDPRGERPSARMPGMNLSEREAADIAAYLATLGEPPAPPAAASASRIAEGGRLFAVQGCVGCHSLRPGDEGERLSLAHVADKWYPSALEEYLREPAKGYRWTRMPDFRLAEEEASAIAGFLLDRSAPAQASPMPDGDARRGRLLVVRLGCAACHAAPVENRLQAPSLQALLEADWRQGCMGDEPGRDHAPHPALTPDEREALRVLAKEGFESLKRRSPMEFASRQVRALRCQACHAIDGREDRWSEHAGEAAHLLPADGDETFGRRPALTWVGEQLQPQWLENTLAGTVEYKARPGMEARMPSLGARPSLLAKGLMAAHGFDENFEHTEPDPEFASIGRRISTDIGGGFGCNFCHDGAVAVDLKLLGERLRPEYFQWKMRTPGRVDRGTAMPQFGNLRDGRTRLRETLDGVADRQFEAIWHFLVDNRISRRDPGDAEPDARWADLYNRMNTGPFYSGVISVPGDGQRPKGLSIRVGDRQRAAVHFDHDLLRLSAAWTGEFLRHRSIHDWGTRNHLPPEAAGEVRFISPSVAGWTHEKEAEFTDTRKEPFGPIPEEQGRYQGVYLHGNRVVLAYNIYGAEVRESPWYLENDRTGAFVRDMQVAGHDRALFVLLFSVEKGVDIDRHGAMQVARSEKDGRVTAAAVRAGRGVKLYESKGRVAVRFDPPSGTRFVRVLFWEGETGEVHDFLNLASEFPDPQDLDRLTEPGPHLWEPLFTQGELGQSEGPYAVDVITAPLENPYDALLLFTGVDFLDDGRAVLTTIHGDVWLVDGIDEPLKNLTWQRYATGLNMPFGVRVVEDKIYVSNEDELTILHDRNGNGEADYYESFTNLISPGAGAWRQAFGLEVDKDGYFYFARGRGHRQSQYENGVIRISPDGRNVEVIATGFRQPFGMGISPEGRITVSQQEGTWTPQTPVSKIDLETRKGSFYGYQPNRFRREDPYPRELGYEPPMAWLPRNVDNSGGGQVWVESDDWGLPRGQMLHLSYGRRSLLAFTYEQLDGDRQGGVAPLVQFNHLRPRTGRFRSRDGNLYVAGLNPGGFERVRYTGEKVHVPVAIAAHKNGIRIRFNHPLDPVTASEAGRYAVHRWNYRWSEGYGSEFYSVKDPDLMGEDPVEVSFATPLDDEREIFLEIPDMVPAMQMRVAYEVRAADGTLLKGDLHHTVHALGPMFHLNARRALGGR